MSAGGSGTPGTPSYIGPGTGWTGNSVDGSRGTHAIGGGRGADYQPNTAAHTGGSGGGGDYNSNAAGYGFNPSTPGPIRSGEPRYWPGDTQGMPGGDGATGYGQIGGGGGGAGGSGIGAGSGFTGGNGVRIPTTWRTPDINIGLPVVPMVYGTAVVAVVEQDLVLAVMVMVDMVVVGPGNSGGGGTAGTVNSGGGGGGIPNADGGSGGSGGTGFVLIGYPT